MSNLAYSLPAHSPRREPQTPHIEIVSTRSQRRARPKLFYAAVGVAGLFLILVAQLLLSILLSNGAYQISDLQAQHKELARDQQTLSEEINVIIRGGNYGWNFREARGRGPRANTSNLTFIDPVWDYPRGEGTSITGGLFYRGARYPELNGHYLFADFASGNVWALQPDDDRRVSADRVRLIAEIPGVTSFGLDPSTGDILLTTLGAGLFRLVPAAASAR